MQSSDQDLDAFLAADVVGPVYWRALHHASTATELAAIARIFPCCQCRGHFLIKEAHLANRASPLTFDDAVLMYARMIRDAGDVFRVTYDLHARVNATLHRDPTWPSLEVARRRHALQPFTRDVLQTVIMTALASLCRSDCDFDPRARVMCARADLTLDVRCQAAALIFRDRVKALCVYMSMHADALGLDTAHVSDAHAERDPNRVVTRLVRAFTSTASSDVHGASDVLMRVLHARCERVDSSP